MALKIMDLFKSIKWAKNGDVTDMSRTNYEAGWSYLGDDTPTVEDFNFVQKLNDEKDQWLFNQIKAVCDAKGIEVTESDVQALLKAINTSATLSGAGITQLSSALDSTLETMAATPKAVKTAYDKAIAVERLANTNKTEFTSFLDLFIGVPIAIPTVALPEINIHGYTVMALDGGRFSTSKYPKLAKVYPSGVKPDLRGEFIRGWDNGRNVDAGRALLSSQEDAMQAIKGAVGNVQFIDSTMFGSSGALNQVLSPRSVNLAQFYSTSPGTGEGTGRIELDSSRVSRTAKETRPRNIAFQYICLAA